MAERDEDKAWAYRTSEELDLSLLERLMKVPREPEMAVYLLRAAAALGLRLWLRLYHRFTVAGRQHLPARGSYILVANHASHLDALCLLSTLPLAKLHRAYPAAASDYFFTSPARRSLVTLFLNALPLERHGGASGSLELCRAVLAAQGNILLLFPEGTRTATGALGPFKAGIGLLAGGAAIPVLPCLLEGCFQALPRGRWWPRPGKVRLVIGAPRNYAAWTDPLAVAEDLRGAVRALAQNGTG